MYLLYTYCPAISYNSNYKPLKVPPEGGGDEDPDDETTPSLPTASTSGVRDTNKRQVRRLTSGDDDGAAEHAERDPSSFALLRSYFFR